MQLVLEDGTKIEGKGFGANKAISGELIFNTGIVGYTETLTDPSYYGQVLVFTYPLIGNYGIPRQKQVDQLEAFFESSKIYAKAIVVTKVTHNYSHWNAVESLDSWLKRHDIVGIEIEDTRALTKKLSTKGTQACKILPSNKDIPFYDLSKENAVAQVSLPETIVYGTGKKRVLLVDLGCKNSIIRSFINRDVSVIRVPWNYDFTKEKYDGLFLSNGPGNPFMVQETIANMKEAYTQDKPIFGICMGHQIMALATGAKVYKLKFGHHSQNQPCIQVGTKRNYITSQNHNYAVNDATIPIVWRPWFFNANDGSNEGIQHASKPFSSVQFHPEASPGPVDTSFLFDRFIKQL